MKAKKAQMREMVGGGIGVAVIIGIVILIVGGFFNVPPGHVGVKFQKVGANKGFIYEELGQGFGMKVPFTQVVWDMPFQSQTITFLSTGEGFAAITPKDKNGINYQVDLAVRYKLDQTQAAEFMELKGKGVAAMEQILITATRADSTRGVFGQYAQEDVPQNRIEIAAKVREVLQARLNQEKSGKLKDNFIIVEAVDIRNVEFNPQIEERIIQKQQRLQEAQEMVYKQEIAEKARDIELINADRDKQAAILRAEGLSQAIILEGSAKAVAVEKVNEAYQNMPMEYVYTRYAEAIKATDKIYMGFESLGGNQMSFLDVGQATGLVGAKVIAQTE